MEISFKEFLKLDLRIGKVVEAERVKGSEKLIRLIVDLGDEKRQLVGGLYPHYSPEELVGKEVVVVVNLKPKKMFGLVSQGMLLAAVHNNEPVLIIPEKEVPPGSKVT